MRTDDYVAKLMSIAQGNDNIQSIDVRIAQVMLANLRNLGNMQNQELADLCYVDPATVSRFVRSLGFIKYGEFKSYFKEYNEIRNVDYYFNLEHIPSRKDVFESSIKALKKSYQLLDEKQLSEVVNLILNAENILLGGDRFSQLVAHDFQLKLLSLGRYAKTYSDIKLQYEEVKRSKGLLVLFSASMTRSENLVSLAKSKGWKVILITRNRKSKGDQVICYDSQYLSDWTVNSVNDRLCMAMIVDQIIIKIASSAIN